MSGHSKWANIKHKKGKTDALKAKLATKIGREITVAARMGGADPTGNMRLKLALQKARENNIPKDKPPNKAEINSLFIFICLFKVISIVISNNKS